MPTGGDDVCSLGVERKSSVRCQTDANDPHQTFLHSNMEMFVRNCWIVFHVMKLGGSLRKFVRGALLVCLAILAVPVALFATLWLWNWYQTVQVENFYRENRLLGAMRAEQRDSANDSPPAREALLKIVPLGTDREATIALLRKEKLGCQGIAGPLNCQTMTPNVLGYKQWIVDLEFDADGRLSNAHVAIWNIFL
jgi:hypothetical protein